jgi:hypothetical protein
MDLKKIGSEGVDWIHDRVKWPALVNTVMNLWFHKMLGICQVAGQLFHSEGLNSM